jgi:hypothetical protein
METPRGYNPVAQPAPGLPRHDAPLPGHAPIQFDPLVNSDTFGWTANGYNVNYRGPGLGDAFGKWSCRFIMAFITYLILPMQLVLYPVAGMPAFAAGYFIDHAGLAAGAGYDASMGWAWTCAWLVLLPAMRIETGIETQVPGYRTVRHLFRVLIGGAWFYYAVLHKEVAGTSQLAALDALVVAALIHFILRFKLARGMWDSFQMISWLRKA